MKGNLRFKIDWVSLIVGRKFTVLALFHFVFEGNFQVQGLYLEGRFNGGFFALRVWEADIWRGLFSKFYGIVRSAVWEIGTTSGLNNGLVISPPNFNLQ